MLSHSEKILILAKTYPVPSARYSETACVAGLNDEGFMRRLFPVQFRFLEGERQFHKWQWITINVKKAHKDHRPESHIIDPDSLICGQVIKTGGRWSLRRPWLNRIPTFSSFEAMEEARQERQITLALLHPLHRPSLEITPEAAPDWTPAELAKLTKDKMQGDLFRPDNDRPILQKIPFAFHYRYTLRNARGQEKEWKHKIIDWEVCQLYRRCRSDRGPRWEEPFREKMETWMFKQDLSLLMGTIHRWPGQWLIISLIYPPPRLAGEPEQGRLFNF